MTNGDWKFTGETIQFSTDGQLMDGQHRLLALLVSNTSQTFNFVYGINKEAFDVIDSGKTRSFADVAQIKGYSDPLALTSLARFVIANSLDGSLDPQEKRFRCGGAYQITKSQVLTFLEHNPDLPNYLTRYRKCSIISPVTAAFCNWLLTKDNETAALEYLDNIIFGYNLKPNTIQSYVHNKLMRNAKAFQNKMTKKAIISNIILGYNRVMGYSKNKSQQITWDVRDGFPKVGR